jgi:hypothetical protein
VNTADSDSELSEVEDTTPPQRSNGASKPVKRNGAAGENGRTKKRSAEESPVQSSNSRKRVRVVGTRVSLRLKGAEEEKEEEEEWQAVPDEWLGKEEKHEQSMAKDDPFGSDSDLTEVDELERELEEDRRRRKRLEDSQKRRQSGRKKGQGVGKKSKGMVEKSKSVEQEEAEEEAADGGKPAQLPIRLHVAPLVDPMLPPVLPLGFVEWETVCF